MDTRREFLRKSLLLSGATGLFTVMPSSIQKALAINPATGSTFLDAEHIVILMQENRSFDHCFGTMQGVRGFNDPRAVSLPDKKPVWFQTDALGNTYSPFRLDIKNSKVTWTGDLPHSRSSQVDAYNGGKYDKWLPSKESRNKKFSIMPMTLGHYTREDLPFNYALADAFTVCDHNFCSAMTSTTPNRSFFWSGKITHDEDGIPKANIRNEDYGHAKQPWRSFPELLTENNINWKFYQNEIGCGGGFKGDERSWLGNFGCNGLEFFKAYNVKFTKRYVDSLKLQMENLPGEINKLQEATPSSEEAGKKIKADLVNKAKALDKATAEYEIWNSANFDKLTPVQKTLFESAFVTNKADAKYRSLSTISYDDNGTKRDVVVPASDLLYQFRQDVNQGKLPTVSWLAGPQNFSDHPSAPWYGSWYISEVMDILTKNPEVWKKTIFIVTYDENDGYYDHLVPYSIPDNNKPETGKVSKGIDTEIEHVRIANEIKQGVPEKQAREAPIGLGFRVPMMIASPWSRGGKVCSEVFDHTSTLQFLETFINKKYKKNLHLDTISAWRRTICGDLTSVFAPFDATQTKLPFLNRDGYVETIFSAQFKQDPTMMKPLSNLDINKAINGEDYSALLSQQEKGIRKACALPYQFDVVGAIADGKNFQIKMKVDNQLFADKTGGAPFTVYAPGSFKENGKTDVCRNWAFAVKTGDTIDYAWPIDAFGDNYHLRLHSANGFYREFKGSAKDPKISITANNELNRLTKIASGNVVIKLKNNGPTVLSISIADLSYKTGTVKKNIAPDTEESVVLNLQKTFGWYDFEIKVDGNSAFAQRFAGKIETGKETFTDPLMGKMLS